MPQALLTHFTHADRAKQADSNVSYYTAYKKETDLTYDPAGNVIQDALHSYSYDAEGNLTKVDAGNTATYIYDAFNRRVESTSEVGAQPVMVLGDATVAHLVEAEDALQDTEDVFYFRSHF